MRTMNKIFRFLLMGALVCGLGLSVASCSDDDEEKVDERIVTDENGNAYIPAEKMTDQERYLVDAYFAVSSILRNLAGVEEVSPDVLSTTHEPIYGASLDGDDSTVRAVKCDTITDAERMFRHIADLDSASAQRLLTPTPDGYVLTLKDLPLFKGGKKLMLGTLTFHRDGGPRRYGWVDVDIPCIPHLERIDYLGPETSSDNDGSNSAYRLGDIVWVPGSTGFCEGYYLCISPFDGINSGYLVHLSRQYSSGGNSGETVNLDGDDEGCFNPLNSTIGEKHKTTADIVMGYLRFIRNNQGKVRNIKAFMKGMAYNTKPTHPDKIEHIFPDGFAVDNWIHKASERSRIWYKGEWTGNDAGKYIDLGLFPMRKGYNISTGISCYNPDGDAVWEGWIEYYYNEDWQKYWNANSARNYCMNTIAFTGKTIGSLDYSPLNDPLELGIKPQDVTSEQIGWYYCSDGMFYESEEPIDYAGVDIRGELAYVNDGSFFGSMVTEEENGGGRGLVLGNFAVDKEFTMNPDHVELFTEENGFSSYIGTTMESALNDYGGYLRTSQLYYADANIPAIKYMKEKYEDPTESTGWFIPSAAQWMAMLCKPGLGGSSKPTASKPISQALTNNSLLGSGMRVWSLSAINRETTATFYGLAWQASPKQSGEAIVIPVFAFGPAVEHNSSYDKDKSAYEKYMAKQTPPKRGIYAEYVSTDELGWWYADNDYIYEDIERLTADGAKPLGIIAYVNDGSDTGNKATEAASGYGHALVMSCNFISDQSLASGSPLTSANGFDNYVGTTWEKAITDFGGYKRTQALNKLNSRAAKKTIGMSPSAPKKSSGWFIPTTGQWVAMVCAPGLGGIELPKNNSSIELRISNGKKAAGVFNNILSQYSSAQQLTATVYSWTMSAFDASKALVIDTNEFLMRRKDVGSQAMIRPVFAY